MKITKLDAQERLAIRRAFFRFLVILLVLIFIASLLISYDWYQTRKHEIFHEQEEILISTMIDYRNYISYMTSIVRTIEAEHFTFATNNADHEIIKALFMEYMRNYPIIDKLRILDTHGMEILRLNQGNGSPYVVALENLQDQSSRYFYYEAQALNRHQFLFSALDLNMDNGVIDIDPLTGKGKPTLRITSPVDIHGQRMGYLVVNFLMRHYLDSIRTSPGTEGCAILLFDENGYLFNDANDANNFGFMYGPESERYRNTIYSIIPTINLCEETRSFVEGNKICTYMSFDNIYNRSQDYYLSDTAPRRLFFLVYYDNQSPYAEDLYFSYFHYFAASIQTQLLVCCILVFLYVLTLYSIFSYDKLRFTNLFSDHRYTKAKLRRAIHRKEFTICYQPIINIQNGQILGFEALSRWRRNTQVLPPSQFIDEILHYQLGQMLDENAFSIVRNDRKRMEPHEGFKDTFISINCCQQTFNNLAKDPPRTSITLTEKEKKYIVLELLEDIVFSKSTQERIQTMYQHNIIFAIDDFGTGYSNVAFIRNFENLKIKIDRAFVPVDMENMKERIIIEAFVKMFVDQGLRLIVEGVETQAQCRYLKKLGIAGVQGFYFSMPMTLDEMFVFVEKKEYLDKL